MERECISHFYQVCDCINDKIRLLTKTVLLQHIIDCDCEVCRVAREIYTISDQVRGGERDGNYRGEPELSRVGEDIEEDTKQVTSIEEIAAEVMSKAFDG